MNLEKLVIPFQVDTKDAKTGVGKLSDSFKEFTGFSLGAAGAIGVAGAAVQQITRFLNESNAEALAYANATRDGARITGMATDEYQKLVQVADDVRISQEGLQKAMEMANKKGFATSIDSIGKMADEYNALGSATEKATYLTERFGKSGQEMGKLFELGSEGIQKGVDAVSSWLVLTPEQLTSLEKQRLATDDLADSWEGVKLQIGAATANSRTWMAQQVSNGIKNAVTVDALNKKTQDFVQWNIISQDTANSMWKDYQADTMTALEFSAELDAKQTEYNNNRIAQKDTEIGMMLRWQANKQWEIDLTVKQKEAQDELNDAIERQKAVELRFSVAKQKFSKDIAKQLIYDNMEAAAAKETDAAKQKELNYQTEQYGIANGILDPKLLAVADATEYLNMKEEARTITLSQENDMLNDFIDIIDKTPKYVTTDFWRIIHKIEIDHGSIKAINAKTAANLTYGQSMAAMYAAMQNNLIIDPSGAASGGSFMIPDGYSKDNYPLYPGVNVQSGERVDIIPKKDVNKPVVAQIDEKSLARSIAEALMLAGVAN